MDIEFALIADYAETVSGKLYLMGGGWDTVFVSGEAGQAHHHVRLAVAVGVRVGWEETNEAIPVRITVEDDDGAGYLQADGVLNVGRPPGLPPGSTQLAQMTANLAFNLPRLGGYRMRIRAGNGERVCERLLPFRLVVRA